MQRNRDKIFCQIASFVLKLEKTKEKIMKNIKHFICLVLSAAITFAMIGCGKTTKDEAVEYLDIYGIAIYQNSPENKNFSIYSQNPKRASNLISTINERIVYAEEPEFLFYVYTKNPINLETKSSDYISNTTIEQPTISNNAITFSLERIKESSSILIFYIYKNKNNFMLQFIRQEDILQDSDELIEFELNNMNFSKVVINLRRNISIKNEY